MIPIGKRQLFLIRIESKIGYGNVITCVCVAGKGTC